MYLDNLWFVSFIFLLQSFCFVGLVKQRDNFFVLFFILEAFFIICLLFFFNCTIIYYISWDFLYVLFILIILGVFDMLLGLFILVFFYKENKAKLGS